MRSQVFVERYSLMTGERFEEILESLGLRDALEKARLVVIKPNLAAGTLKTLESGVVTNPEILEFLVRNILSINTRTEIAIVESDSIGLGLAPEKFRFQGYPDRFGKYPRVKLIDLSRSMIMAYPTSGRFFRQGVVLPKIVVEADIFISLAKIKTHTNTRITGVLKNQFGCLPDSDKDKYHPYLSSVIADINYVIRPDLCIVEGCPAMEGEGPVNGRPKPMDLMILGTDPVAVDSTMARIMGFVPERIPILRTAMAVGLGLIHEQDISVHGISLAQVQDKFAFIGREQQFYIALGFMIQRLGKSIHDFGHLVHLVKSTKWGVGKAFRKLMKKTAWFRSTHLYLDN